MKVKTGNHRRPALAAGLCVTVLLWLVMLPEVGVSSTELSVAQTPESVARGEYLVLRVLGCQGCHTERDLDRYGYPPKEDRLLAGGLIFRALGERAVSPNITPYALASWSDQELFDAITTGLRPDGRVLASEMPYERYGTLSREAVYDIIAYLRSIEPIAGGPYPAEFRSGDNAFVPQFGTLLDPGPAAGDAARGAYLVAAAGCNGCHDGVGEGRDGQLLAGGREFEFPGRGIIRAANLTPDVTTGLGGWTQEAFLARFLTMRGAESSQVDPGQPNTVMHWWQYAYLTEDDLRAIYAYLMGLPPMENQISRFEPLGGDMQSPNWSEQEQTAD